MKALANSYCYWTGIDRDIEELVKSCRDCAKVLTEPSKVQIHPWEVPAQPWQRLHIDFEGPFIEYFFSVIVDAKTKWLEAFPMRSITSFFTIRALRETFSRLGIPSTLVSDNAQPSTNKKAERFVRILKNGLRSSVNDPGDLHARLHRLLMQYRKTPSTATGKSPAELMLIFSFRTRLDLLKYTYAGENERNNECKRSCDVEELVQVRYYQNKETSKVDD
ncbi:uncharacterized protein K02A2.6-like [Eupeodes corollae]|uniref:uncharacterized protein K02A2.6-like n=1 Tax=Eupeodes corollae TaxID=290404 RepID=UPI002491B4D4|nr:uncharacterized protein K02A2.6-like [Eupeodes corollae]